MSPSSPRWAVPAAMYALGSLLAAAWAVARPGVHDWDPAYYRTVAEHILAGEGAVTGALWSLLWLPESLPFAADLHWMPLPSRVLVPALALWPAAGDRMVAVLVAGAMGPLAWATARALGLDRGLALLAGLVGATGLAWAGILNTADSAGLFALLGGGALLAVARGRPWVAAALVAAAALTRTDGLLLAPFLALGLPDRGGRRDWRALVVALAGPLAAALWHLRGLALVGGEYRALRQLSSQVLDHEGLLTGVVEVPTAAERLAWLGEDGVGAVVVYALVFLPVPVVLTLWRHRARWVRAAALYMVGMPALALALAPGIAASGSLFRSGAALLPLAAAALVADLGAVGRWAHRVRGYHPLFVPAVAAPAVVLAVIGLGPLSGPPHRLVPDDLCAPLEGVDSRAPVLSRHPLLVEARCGHPGAVVVAGMPPGRLAEVVQRYGIRHALATPDDLAEDDELGATAADLEILLPTWERDGLLLTAP